MLLEHKLKNILRAGIPQGNGRAGKKTWAWLWKKRWWTELYGLGVRRGNVIRITTHNEGQT